MMDEILFCAIMTITFLFNTLSFDMYLRLEDEFIHIMILSVLRAVCAVMCASMFIATAFILVSQYA